MRLVVDVCVDILTQEVNVKSARQTLIKIHLLVVLVVLLVSAIIHLAFPNAICLHFVILGELLQFQVFKEVVVARVSINGMEIDVNIVHQT